MGLMDWCRRFSVYGILDDAFIFTGTFQNKIFFSVCPRRQEPQTYGEFVEGSFTTARNALERWEKAEILISPPVLITMQTLAEKEILIVDKLESAEVKK